jgi:prolyl 4-hydroxylase
MFSSILYLNDDFDGGETVFPKIDKIIKPKPGNIYIWRNAFDDLKLDEKSFHGGNPIEAGVKYIIVIWTRSNIVA